MAWIQVHWELFIPDPEEGEPGESGAKDEPSLQFALVTAFSGTARVHRYTTGNLFPHNPGLGPGDPRTPIKSGDVSSKNVPTERDPFFGIVVRAVEQDRSQNREDDNDRFYDAIMTAAQARFDVGQSPSVTDLWQAGNSVALENTWRDDDDLLGVSARVYPFYGSDNWRHLQENEERLGGGGQQIIETRQWFRFAFVSRRTARYELVGQIRLVTNDPGVPRLIGDRTEE